MRRVVPFVLTVAAIVAFSRLGILSAADDKPKYTIKEVMKKAHTGKPPLCKTVSGGKATKEEKAELLELYTALAANKPPKGDEKDWKEKTGALVKAAKEIVDGKEGGEKDLGKALNCKACHEAHKGK